MNIFIIGGLLAVMLIIGMTGARKIDGPASYFVGRRTAGTMAVTGSLLATILGGSNTLGVAGLGYSKGLAGSWWLLSGAVCLMVFSFWLAAKVRKLGSYTIAEVLGRQYQSNAVRIAASIIICTAWIGIVAGQTSAAGHLLSALWPGRLDLMILVSGIVFTCYTVLGGQYSIIKTDFLQSFIILFGIIMVVVFGMHAAGGFEQVLAQAPQGTFTFPLSESLGFTDLLMYFLFVGMAFLVGPDIYSRVLSSRDTATAKRSTCFAAAALAIMALALAMVGILARILLPDIPAEKAFPQLALHVLPNGLNGLVIAALLAAVMSSADTCLLTAATIISSDIVKPLCGERLDDRRLVLLTRGTVIVLGVGSMLMALKLQGIIASLLLAYTVYSSGVAMPVLFGFYAEKLELNATGALCSIMAGGLAGLALKLGGQGQYLFLVFPLSIAALFLGSKMQAKRLSPSLFRERL